MTKARVAILVLLSVCSALSIVWGFALERSARGTIVDFKISYYGALCLLQNRDPYSEKQIESVYEAERGKHSPEPAATNQVPRVVALQLYFPTAFLCMAPFALMPLSSAYLLWTSFTVVTFTLAAFLIWTLAQDHAPNVAFYSIAFLLANCGIVFAGGNPSGLAIGLCLVGVWCFLENRSVLLGIVCLALSLELKPHDTALVWLYFFLAGGAHRRRALQTLALTVVLALPAFLWVSHVSSHWMQELSTNLSVTSAHGEVNDPVPSLISRSGGGTIIDLQTVIAAFDKNPLHYNAVALLICGSLLLVWMIVSLRGRATHLKDYLAFAVIAPLTMLPVYHRPHDAKLLLLTLPACAMLLAEGGRVGKVVLVLNSLAIVITSDLPLAMLSILTKDLHLSAPGLPLEAFMILVARPIPILLLALSCLYLWVYTRRCMSIPDGESSPDHVVLPKNDPALPESGG